MDSNEADSHFNSKNYNIAGESNVFDIQTELNKDVTNLSIIDKFEKKNPKIIDNEEQQLEYEISQLEK